MSTTKPIKPMEGYTRMTDNEVVSRGTAVVNGMTGNPNFTNVPVDLTALKSNIDRLAALIAEALDGSKKIVAQKNSERENVIGMLRLLGRYVEVTCRSDLAMFQSSGFQPAPPRQPSPPQPVPVPGIAWLDHGAISGQLLVKFKGHKSANSYELRYGVTANGSPPGTWTTIPVATVKAAIPINGLTPGTVYAVQARAFGKLGYTDWSDSATRMCT